MRGAALAGRECSPPSDQGPGTARSSEGTGSPSGDRVSVLRPLGMEVTWGLLEIAFFFLPLETLQLKCSDRKSAIHVLLALEEVSLASWSRDLGLSLFTDSS